MKIKYGSGTTEYGPGVDIVLDGNELAIAITEYIERQGAVISGARTVTANYGRCRNARIYVDPSGLVNYSGKEFSGRGPRPQRELEEIENAVKAEREEILETLTESEIVEEIYNAMRFEREESTPSFKNGTTLAENRARITADRIAEIIERKINEKT